MNSVKLIALTLDERAVVLASLEDAPPELSSATRRPAQRSSVEARAKGSTEGPPRPWHH